MSDTELKEKEENFGNSDDSEMSDSEKLKQIKSRIEDETSSRAIMRRAEEKAQELEERQKALDDQLGKGYREEGSSPRNKLANVFSKGRNRKLLLGGGGAGLIIAIIIIIFLGAFKIPHFQEVLVTSGYARLHGIMKERTTQNIFDASVVRGQGSATLGKKTLLEKLSFKNVDQELAKMGRAEDFALFNDSDGKTHGFKVKNETIDLNQISKELGFGDNFNDLSFRQQLTVKARFVEQAKKAISEQFSTDARVIRTRTTNVVAQNVGFKWSRWRQYFRDKFGAEPDPVKVDTEDRLEQAKQTNDQGGVKTGVDEIDKAIETARDPERLRKLLEKGGGELDPEILRAALADDIARASKIQNIAGTASMVVLVLSIACMANQAIQEVPQIAKNNEKQASLVALNLAAAGNQVKEGEVTSVLVGTGSRQLDGADRAPDYQRQFNGVGDPDVEVPRITPRLAPGYVSLITKLTSPTSYATGGLGSIPPFSSITDWVDDKFCDFILSPTGAVVVGVGDIVVQVVIGVFTAGGFVAAEQAGGRALAQIIIRETATAVFQTARGLVSAKSLGALIGFGLYGLGLELAVNWLAGTEITGGGHGPEYFEQAYVGTIAVQDRLVRSNLYGKPVPDAQMVPLDKEYLADATSKWHEGGALKRYFAVSNPLSLTSAVVARVPSTLDGVSRMIGSLFTNIAKVFDISMFSKLTDPFLNKKLIAEEPQTNDARFDLKPWGFSPDELDKMANDPSYSIAENEDHITDEEIKNFDETIGVNCYDPALTQNEIDAKPECSTEALSSDKVLRWRIFKLDSNIVNMMIGQEGVGI